MLIRLVQYDCEGKEKTVDIAGNIYRLNFSALRGFRPWEVYVRWGNREECIARINWEPAAAYQIFGVFPDGSCPMRIILCSDHIVPTVKRQLAWLFRDGKINQLYRRQGIVVVQPIE